MSHDPVIIEQAEITGWQTVSKRGLLDDTPLRRELFTRHPALRGEPQITTPMAKEMYIRFRAGVLLGQCGTFFTGAPGDGKSSALRVCARLLERDYPHIATYQQVCTEMPISQERFALQDMLASAGHAVLSGGPIILRERLVAKIVDDLRRRGTGHTAVWCVDNAHNMQRRGLELLTDLQHRLWDTGVQLLTVMMVDAPGPVTRSTGMVGDSTALSRRFFTHEDRLHGLRDPAQVSEILDAFDTLDFPEGTDVRWTEFFLPQAYQHGLRLSEEGHALYEAMAHCPCDIKRGPATLATLFGAIRWALVRSAGLDNAQFRFSPDVWQRAVHTVALQTAYAPPRLYGRLS